MQKIKNDQLGFGAVEIVVVIVVLAVLGVGGWMVYKSRIKTTPHTTPTTNTNTTKPPTTATDPTAGWKKVDSIGGAFSMKVPDGWELTNYPGDTIHGDSIAYASGKPAIITAASTAYAGDQKRFNVSFSEKTNGQSPVPQWQSPNPYGTEATEDFSIGGLKGTRFSIEYTQTVTGITKGDKLYQYEFFLPNGKGLNVVYIQYAGDADNLKTVEQAIQTIVIN